MARERSRRPFSLAKLAKKLGVSLRQARRLWAEPRSQYEARSLARHKPWAAEGISRATWYRRNARMRDAETGEQDPARRDGEE